MGKKKIEIGATMLAAFAASSCCIIPLIAVVIGGSGSALSWMAPFRPFLIGFTLLALGYTWRKQLKKQRNCCDTERPSEFIKLF